MFAEAPGHEGARFDRRQRGGGDGAGIGVEPIEPRISAAAQTLGPRPDQSRAILSR